MANEPYEALFRFLPAFAGHTIRLNASGVPGIPLALGKDSDFPLDQIGGAINAASLAEIQRLTDALNAATQKATQDLAAANAATDAAKLSTVQALTQVQQLQSQLAKYTAPVDSTTDVLLNHLNVVFGSIPTEQQAQFASEYATVRVLLQAGQAGLALGVVQSVAVPDSLASIKADIIAALS